MRASIADTIRERLSARQNEMVEFLIRLVEAESPTVDPDSQRGPQQLLTERLESLGFRVRHYPGKTSGGTDANSSTTDATIRRI